MFTFELKISLINKYLVKSLVKKCTPPSPLSLSHTHTHVTRHTHTHTHTPMILINRWTLGGKVSFEVKDMKQKGPISIQV